MNRRSFAALVALAGAGCGSSKTEAATADTGVETAVIVDSGADVITPAPFLASTLASKKRLMWIAAHPDDELTVAAVFGEAGAELGATLTFVLATDGEKSTTCLLPEGCADLPAIRAKEMQASADLLGGRSTKVIRLGLADGANGFERDKDPRPVLAAWSASAGGLDALIAKFVTVIRDADPAAVITLDPRNGETCHPDHRATGWLVAMARARLGADAPPLYVAAATAAVGEMGGFGKKAMVDDPRIVILDQTRWAPALGDQVWGYLPRMVALHPSQLPASFGANFAKAPPELRRDFLLPMPELSADTRFDDCDVAFGHSPSDYQESDAGVAGDAAAADSASSD